MYGTACDGQGEESYPTSTYKPKLWKEKTQSRKDKRFDDNKDRKVKKKKLWTGTEWIWASLDTF